MLKKSSTRVLKKKTLRKSSKKGGALRRSKKKNFKRSFRKIKRGGAILPPSYDSLYSSNYTQDESLSNSSYITIQKNVKVYYKPSFSRKFKSNIVEIAYLPYDRLFLVISSDENINFAFSAFEVLGVAPESFPNYLAYRFYNDKENIMLDLYIHSIHDSKIRTNKYLVSYDKTKPNANLNPNKESNYNSEIFEPFEAYVYNKNVGLFSRKTRHKCSRNKKDKCYITIKKINDSEATICFSYGNCKTKDDIKTINDEVDEVYTISYLEMRYAQKKIIVITKDKDGKKKEFDLVHEDFRLLCDNLNKRLPKNKQRPCNRPNKNIWVSKY